MLVAPILYENMRERTVYLPEGIWRNINDNEEYQGKQMITTAAPIDELPVFVKAGTMEELK